MIQRIDIPLPLEIAPATEAPGSRGGDLQVKGGPGFSDVLTSAISEASDLEKVAVDATDSVMSGEGSIHDAMIANAKADIALRYAVTLKNRVLEAYREVMSTTV